jgi:uncharacterized protein YgiM (DUF1202 family)
VVSKCAKLNVRNKPNANAKVLKILNAGNQVEIVEKGSTDDFYKVIVTDLSINETVRGFCMKEYITIK